MTAKTLIAIELELTRKSEARYKFIFREYRDLQFDQVWYFVKNLNDKNAILQIAEKTLGFNPGLLLFCVIPDFLKNENPQVYFHDTQKPLPLSRIKFDRSRIYSPAHKPAQGVSTVGAQENPITETAKPSFSEPNSLIPAPLRGGSTTPDPSPPTS